MKKKYLLIFFALLLIIASCARYNQLSVSQEQLLQNKEFVEHINNMNFYVHNSGNIIKLKNVAITDSVINGEVERKITDETEIKNITSPGKKEIKSHKYDINIYTINDIEDATASISSSIATETGISEKISINKNNIEKIEGYTLDKKGTVSENALLVILIVGGILLILAVIGVIVYMSANASADSQGSMDSGDSGSAESSGASADGSAGSSGASNSDSNSDSGDSGSGASSGASSGACYIATMVYGNYDAPEVMVLRNFRDTTLANSYWGRNFIRLYYKYSPMFVEKFKNSKTVNCCAKTILDTWIKYLNK
jgi:hypothetical protein